MCVNLPSTEHRPDLGRFPMPLQRLCNRQAGDPWAHSSATAPPTILWIHFGSYGSWNSGKTVLSQLLRPRMRDFTITLCNHGLSQPHVHFHSLALEIRTPFCWKIFRSSIRIAAMTRPSDVSTSQHLGIVHGFVHGFPCSDYVSIIWLVVTGT